MTLLAQWGFRVNPLRQKVSACEEIFAVWKEWEAKREGLAYELDGLVVKLNSLSLQRKLGETSRAPRWSVACKFRSKQATTRIKGIRFQVGRTGTITPVADLEPVRISGVTVKHATLHNFDEVKRLGVRVGDRVFVERSGDVIPKIVGVASTSARGKGIHPPKKCPVCGSAAVRVAEEVALRCENLSCPAQLEGRLLHFCSRGGMNIEGMGEAVIVQILRKKMVADPADIYFLKKENFLKLELFAEKRAQNLLNQIESSKKRPLSKLIYGLGIRHVGSHTAEILISEFGSLEKLAKAKPADLEAIHEVGPEVAGAVSRFFKLSATKHILSKLKKAGLRLKEEVPRKKLGSEAVPRKGGKLQAKSFVFTGRLESFSRSEAEDRVKREGGRTPSSVSKKTNYVVAGTLHAPSSKYEKAKKIRHQNSFRKEIFEAV